MSTDGAKTKPRKWSLGFKIVLVGIPVILIGAKVGSVRAAQAHARSTISESPTVAMTFGKVQQVEESRPWATTFTNVFRFGGRKQSFHYLVKGDRSTGILVVTLTRKCGQWMFVDHEVLLEGVRSQ